MNVFGSYSTHKPAVQNKLQNSKYVLKSCIFIAKLHWYVKNKFNMDFIMQEYVG